MSGNIDMNGNGITNVATPVNDGDVVNKGYIDNYSGAMRTTLVTSGNWNFSGTGFSVPPYILPYSFTMSNVVGMIIRIPSFTWNSSGAFNLRVGINSDQSSETYRLELISGDNDRGGRTSSATNLLFFIPFLFLRIKDNQEIYYAISGDAFPSEYLTLSGSGYNTMAGNFIVQGSASGVNFSTSGSVDIYTLSFI